MFRWLRRRRNNEMSDRWLLERAVEETKLGWDGGTRWRSPAEIATMRRDAKRREEWQRAQARKTKTA